MLTVLIVSQILSWVVILGLGLALLALARQVGVLHVRLAPAGALLSGKGPVVGEAAIELACCGYAQEIWVLNGNTHKLIGRHALPDELKGKLVNIAVSQDSNFQVYASDGSGNTFVLDAETLEKKQKMENSGGGILYTVQP